MNSTEVQNSWRKVPDKCLCLLCVQFCSCPCRVCSRVALLLDLQTLSLTNKSSSDTKAFLCFIVFSGSPTAVHRPLHALRYYTVGIPLWTARSQTSKFDRKTTIPYAQVTWSHQELMSGEATKERVTPVPSKSRLLPYFCFGEAQCTSYGLSPTLGHAAMWENKRWQNCKYKK